MKPMKDSRYLRGSVHMSKKKGSVQIIMYTWYGTNTNLYRRHDDAT
jgi:hypothetical protein